MCAKTNFINDVKTIIQDDDLQIYEKMVLIIFKTYAEEHHSIFPAYETIASLGSMSKRKAQYVIKDLKNRGYIYKEHRYKEIDGEKVQTSNLYQLNNTTAPDALTNDPDLNNSINNAYDALVLTTSNAPSASYKESSLNKSLNNKLFKDIKEEEEEYSSPQKKLTTSKFELKYPNVYNKMILQQGTGSLNYLQTEFLENCYKWSLPESLVEPVYENLVNFDLLHFDAFERAFIKFGNSITKRNKNNTIKNPINWLSKVIENEDILVRCENSILISS